MKILLLKFTRWNSLVPFCHPYKFMQVFQTSENRGEKLLHKVNPRHRSSSLPFTLRLYYRRRSFQKSVYFWSLPIKRLYWVKLRTEVSASYHRFRWNATLENKTLEETFPKFPSILRVIDMLDRNPPITATSLSLRHASGLWLVDFDPTCR